MDNTIAIVVKDLRKGLKTIQKIAQKLKEWPEKLTRAEYSDPTNLNWWLAILCDETLFQKKDIVFLARWYAQQQWYYYFKMVIMQIVWKTIQLVMN